MILIYFLLMLAILYAKNGSYSTSRKYININELLLELNQKAIKYFFN